MGPDRRPRAHGRDRQHASARSRRRSGEAGQPRTAGRHTRALSQGSAGAALVFALIAQAALLAQGFDRRGPWKRTLTAVVVVIGVQALTLAAASLATRWLAVVPLLYLLTLLPALGALLLLLGVPPGRRSAVPEPA